jgi:hypothetical protein
MAIKSSRFLPILALLILFSSCGKTHHGPATEGARSSDSEGQSKMEVVWFDSTIVESNQQMTLIRSDRVDSVQMAAGEISTKAAPAISFQITQPACVTTIGLLDAREKILQLLLSRTLEPGFYKLTVHKPPPAAIPNVPFNYMLQARYCGQTKTIKISAGWNGPNN